MPHKFLVHAKKDSVGVAVEKGFFDQQGLIVNASPESSGQVALQALTGGSTDFAVGANVRPIQALAQDLPIKVTYPFFVMTTEDTIKKKPEMVQKFANAWVRTLDYIHRNKAEVAELMRAFFAREGTRLSKETVQKLLDGTNYNRARVGETDIDDTMESAKIQFEMKRLKKLPDLKQHVDSSFVEKAEKAMKPAKAKR